MTHVELVDLLIRFRDPAAIERLRGELKSATRVTRFATAPMIADVSPPTTRAELASGEWLPGEDGIAHDFNEAGEILRIKGDLELLLIHDTEHGGHVRLELFRNGTPREVGWVTGSATRPDTALVVTKNAVCEVRFVWSGANLDEATVNSWSVPCRQPLEELRERNIYLETGDTRNRQRIRYLRDERQRLTRIIEDSVDGNHRPRTCFVSVPDGATADSILTDAEERLLAAVRAVIVGSGTKEPIATVFLPYTGVDTDIGGFPPQVILVSERDRDRVLRRDSFEAAFTYWNPQEYEDLDGVRSLTIDDPELSDQLQRLFQITIQENAEESPEPGLLPQILGFLVGRDQDHSGYRPVRRMFQRVCARLNRQDWGGILPKRCLFLPTDPHGAMSAAVDLRACATVGQRWHVWWLGLYPSLFKWIGGFVRLLLIRNPRHQDT